MTSRLPAVQVSSNEHIPHLKFNTWYLPPNLITHHTSHITHSQTSAPTLNSVTCWNSTLNSSPSIPIYFHPSPPHCQTPNLKPEKLRQIFLSSLTCLAYLPAHLPSISLLLFPYSSLISSISFSTHLPPRELHIRPIMVLSASPLNISTS